VYRYKLSHTGDIERCRARLVVRGYQQRKGIDFENIFAPVVSYESIRMIISVAAALDLELRQFDVKSAFLQWFIDRDVYVRPPSAELGKNVWKLVKSMYGTHQAPCCWNES
jgi:Reverse transcriptase (RNA-dependent DNA polymerase)